jgi:hypothetical protein
MLTINASRSALQGGLRADLLLTQGPSNQQSMGVLRCFGKHETLSPKEDEGVINER